MAVKLASRRHMLAAAEQCIVCIAKAFSSYRSGHRRRTRGHWQQATGSCCYLHWSLCMLVKNLHAVQCQRHVEPAGTQDNVVNSHWHGHKVCWRCVHMMLFKQVHRVPSKHAGDTKACAVYRTTANNSWRAGQKQSEEHNQQEEPLEGMLPMCSHTKARQVQRSTWQQATHLTASFLASQQTQTHTRTHTQREHVAKVNRCPRNTGKALV
jgi:hypothetical protein